MIFRRLTELGTKQTRLLAPVVSFAHSKTCPAAKPKVCPGSGKGAGLPSRRVPCPPSKTGKSGDGKLVRAIRSGKCRFGFIPEEWFLFFHSKTGVSGPYLLLLGLGNYCASKEILVMEHEYYSGLSVILILYILTTKFGHKIGGALDAGVDEIHASFQKGRDEETAFHKNTINECKLAQTRAQGQKELMTAKKENIALQLEAVYRERVMMVYRTVRGRMDYHVKRSRSIARIQQKWMIQWILENVNKSITPEFQKQALSSAIRDLAAIASQPPDKPAPAAEPAGKPAD